MNKSTIRKKFPFLLYLGIGHSYFNSFKKFAKFSGVVKQNNDRKLVSKIIADYHVIEKGLTMSETRTGFGKERLMALIENCILYIKLYGNNEEQLQHSVGVILEYRDYHRNIDFALDEDLDLKIRELNALYKEALPSSQKNLIKTNYFNSGEGSFLNFSKSRLSVRNYSDEVIPNETLKKATKLARNAPSSCNRQTVKVNVFSDKNQIAKILEIQGGNRGFGHLADKLIILTSDLAYWHGVYEMTGPYVDGGIFAMNLLYALHYYEIGACPLNCNLSPQKDKKLRELCDIPDSEVFVVMISCGKVPDNFKVPASKRYSVDNIIRFH